MITTECDKCGAEICISKNETRDKDKALQAVVYDDGRIVCIKCHSDSLFEVTKSE